jgi:hypothetical protein
VLDTSTWLAAYHHGWITHNAEQLAQLFTEEAVYHTHPFRPRIGVGPRSRPIGSAQRRRKRTLRCSEEPRLSQAIGWLSNGGR